MSGRTDAERERLIIANRALVDRVAAQLHASLPRHVSRADLVSYGTFGLIDAVDRYDPSRGPFEGFATQRIRGAILDGLRAEDWTPRSVRAIARTARDARDRLESVLHRAPTEGEVADEVYDEVGVTGDRLARVLDQVRIHRVATLNIHDEDEDDTVHDYASTLVDRTGSDIGEPELLDQLRVALADGIVRLGDRHRLIIVLRYIVEVDDREERGYSFSEIATMLGVSRALITQLHTAALLDLQTSFRETIAS